MRKLLKNIYKAVTSIFQNIFRSNFYKDMYIAQTNVVAAVHKQTFEGYKDKFRGKDIAIIATGPSLNKYKPIPGTINIGINSAIKYEKIKLDFFFSTDNQGIKAVENELLNAPNVIKFFGVLPLHPHGLKERYNKPYIVSESCILKHKAKKFFVYNKFPVQPAGFNTEIDKTWLADGGSSTFSAMQFALFTNPRRIYLVGCDCSTGYFNGKGKNDAKPFIKVWKELKEFADIYYPETEIISVNPVGLKGIFKDIYQE